MSAITIRVDDDLKKAAASVAGDIGMDLTTAIKIYLKKMVEYHGIPFEVRTENSDNLRREYAQRMHKLVSARHGKVPEVRFTENAEGGVTGPSGFPKELREAWSNE